jgi:competence protein ComEA
MRRSALGLALLAGLAALGGWLSRRPPAWLDSDPLQNPFGRLGETIAAAEVDSVDASAPPITPENPLSLPGATLQELQRLPGVGPVLAGRILVQRDSLGGLDDASDLDAVPGVGPKSLRRLLPLIRFGPSSIDSTRPR